LNAFYGVEHIRTGIVTKVADGQDWRAVLHALDFVFQSLKLLLKAYILKWQQIE